MCTAARRRLTDITRVQFRLKQPIKPVIWEPKKKCIIHERKHAHPITNIFVSIYHRHQKNIFPHPNICRHRTSNESIFKKSCMRFSLAICPFIHLWQPMESPSTMSQTEVCHFDCSGSGNVPKRSWRLKWEPPGITCNVSISWYLSWRAWIMHDHFEIWIWYLQHVRHAACLIDRRLWKYAEGSIRRCECFHNGLQSAGSIHHTHETSWN